MDPAESEATEGVRTIKRFRDINTPTESIANSEFSIKLAYTTLRC